MNDILVNAADDQLEMRITAAVRTVFRNWQLARSHACPSVELLHAYATDALSRSDRESVERHFLACDACLEAAAVARAVGDGTDEEERQIRARSKAPADLVVRSHHGIFEVISTRLKLEWLSQPVMVRGHVVPQGAHFQCYKATQQAVTLLEVCPSEHGAANLQVSLSDANAPYKRPLEIRIYADGREFASSSTSGEPILFEDLTPANWMVRIYREGVMIGETQIELQD